jgi:hypothetical protein
VNPKNNPFPIINPTQKNNPFPIINPNTNPFVNVNPNTNPFVNVNPNTNPFTNVFVGGNIPFIPPLRGFGDGFGFGKRSKRKTKYAPSLTALGFNIRGKKQSNELTGIGIRPIVI